MKEEAKAYLEEALDYIQQHSVMRKRIDWPALRQEISLLAAEAQTPAGTYPAIDRALELLGDHHSFFHNPESAQRFATGEAKWVGLHAFYPEGIIGMIFPGSPAEKAGVQSGERIERINEQPITQLSREQFSSLLGSSHFDLTLARVGQRDTYTVHLQAASFSSRIAPAGRRLATGLGYLNLPGCSGSPEQTREYAQTVQRIIREIDQQATYGWVIDLRRNGGGNMWPMVAGVGPILGEGVCTYFVSPEKTEAASYNKGRAFLGESTIIEVEEPYELKRSWPPVAVLTSPLTGSSGEFLVLAFRRRPHTRSFGESTRGAPTSNESKVLSDGAKVFLTTALGADRTGQTYDGPLLPDQQVKIDWARLGTTDDPVLLAAIQWLHVEEDCL